MQMPANRHPFALFPPLHSGYVAVEICGNFLPRVQAVFNRSVVVVRQALPRPSSAPEYSRIRLIGAAAL